MDRELIEIFNFWEGVLWLGFAAGFALSLIRPGQRAAKLIAALNFAAFGASDFVEMRTGTWWVPWWLAAWKVLCVAVMAVQLFLYTRGRRKEQA